MIGHELYLVIVRSLQLSDLDKFDIVTQELEELQKISAVKEEAYSKFNSAHEVTSLCH